MQIALIILLAVVVLDLYSRFSKLKKIHQMILWDLSVVDRVLLVRPRLELLSKIESKTRSAAQLKLNEASSLSAVNERWKRYQDSNNINDLADIPLYTVYQYFNDYEQPGGYYGNNQAVNNMMYYDYGQLGYNELKDRIKKVKDTELINRVKSELENLKED